MKVGSFALTEMEILLTKYFSLLSHRFDNEITLKGNYKLITTKELITF